MRRNNEDPDHSYTKSKEENGFFKTPVTRFVIDVYLDQSVEEGSTYTKLCQELRNAGDEDVFNFYLGSYGGSCHGYLHIFSAIKASEAKEVNMIVVSPTYSAGSELALSGTSLVLQPHTFLMFHNYSGSSHGKGQEMMKGNKETDRWIKTYFNKISQPFLTKEECDAISKDQDVYVHSNDKDLKARIKRHFHKKEKDVKEEIKS